MPKSKHQIPGRVRSAYEFIKAHRDRYSVQMMCRVLEVAQSGYYDWLLHRFRIALKRTRGEFGQESGQPAMTPDGGVVAFHVEFLDTFVRDMRPAADLAVSIEDSPDPVLERGQVTYTVTVDNLGPGQAPNTRLVDTLPANPTFVSATASQGSCVRDVTSKSGGVLTCELGTIAAGGQATVTIVVGPRQQGPITNTATVNAGAPDSNPDNNSDTETTTVTPR